MAEPSAYFWAPLAFGTVVVVFVIANVIGQLLGAVLRHGLRWSFIQTPRGGGGQRGRSKQGAKSDAAS